MKLNTLVAALLVSSNASALEINDANRAQLEQLKGVGVTLAEKILVERERARFAGWDDLRKRVKGISSKRVSEWQAHGVTVNGQGRAAERKEQGK
jgi:competence protein ComEA